MKALVLLALLLAGCATVPEGMTAVPIPSDRVAQCEVEGGCALVSQSELLQLLLETVDMVCPR